MRSPADLSNRPDDNSGTTAIVEDRALHVRPWVRFFARNVDLILFAFIVGFVVALIFPSLFFHFIWLFPYLALFLWALVEPIFLCTWGTTFGKWLLNIHLQDVQQQKPGYVEALRRSVWVWFAGYGMGLPLISIITLIFSYYTLTKSGTTLWDKNRFIVTHGHGGYLCGIIAALIIILAMTYSIYVRVQLYQLFSHTSVVTQIDEINRSLPKMVDDDTQLNKVSLDDNVVEYHYKLIRASIDDLNVVTFTSLIQTNIIKGVCAEPYMIQLLANGYSLEYTYDDKDDKYVASITVNASDCRI